MSCDFLRNSRTAAGIGESPASHRLTVRSSRSNTSRANALAERPERSIAARRSSAGVTLLAARDGTRARNRSRFAAVGAGSGSPIVPPAVFDVPNPRLDAKGPVPVRNLSRQIKASAPSFGVPPTPGKVANDHRPVLSARGSRERAYRGMHDKAGGPGCDVGHLLSLQVGRDCPDTPEYRAFALAVNPPKSGLNS